MKRIGLTVCLGAMLCLSFAATARAADACETGWSVQEPALQQMMGGVAGYYDGKVFIGGAGNGTAYKAIQIYDIAADTWSEGAAYSAAAGWYSACGAVWEDKLYLLGGMNYGTNDDTTHNMIYDLSDDSWSVGEDLLQAVHSCMAAVLDGKIYLTGGADGWLPPTMHATNDVYYIAEDSWNAFPRNLPSSRLMAASVAVGDEVYIYGGYRTDSGPAKMMMGYLPDTDTWDLSLESLDSERVLPGSFYADGRIYAISGGGENDDLQQAWDSAEFYDIATNTWATFPSAPDPAYYAATAYCPDFGGLTFMVGGYDNGAGWYDTNRMYSFCLSALESIEPSSGARGTNVAVTINGWGFQADDATLYLSNAKRQIYLDDVSVADGNTINAMVPTEIEEGTYDLVIEAASGESDTLTGVYEVTSPDDDDDGDDDSTDDDDDSADDDDDDDSCCG